MFAYSIIVALFFSSCCPLNTSGNPTSDTCSPLQLNNTVLNETENGFYLGSVQNSHISYSFTSKDYKALNVSLEIKTLQENGMIFYVIGSLKKDFYGLYLSHSELQVSYHCDGYLNSYSIRVPVNDGKWHKLRFTSNVNRTEIVIDDNFYTGRTSGCKKFSLVSPYYFGSVDYVHYETAKKHLENQNKPFVGCMRNFSISEYDNYTMMGVIPCLTKAESGMFFDGDEAYAVADEHFKYGKKFVVQMKIKPKTMNGTLIFYQAKNDRNYLILQLIDSLVRLTIDNHDGPAVSTVFNCSRALNFCDGEWHTITIYKNKNVHVLAVDGRAAPPIFDYSGNLVESEGPLYIGGLPAVYIERTKGVKYSQYLGCIKDLSIDERQEDFFTLKRSGSMYAIKLYSSRSSAFMSNKQQSRNSDYRHTYRGFIFITNFSYSTAKAPILETNKI